MTRAPNASSPTSRRKRAPGRPAGGHSAEPSAQRAQLLDAAIACFVRKGIAGTSLRDIAQEAQVTPSLLHYYFGDKAQLQTALAEERLLPLIGQLHAPLERAGDDIAALIAAFVAGVGGIAVAHPWLPALWVREVLCEGGALREFLFQRVGPAILLSMERRFAAAQARGELNDDLDPRLLTVSLVGLTAFPIASAPIWQRLFADDPAAVALDLDTLRRHTLALLDRGVARAAPGQDGNGAGPAAGRRG